MIMLTRFSENIFDPMRYAGNTFFSNIIIYLNMQYKYVIYKIFKYMRYTANKVFWEYGGQWRWSVFRESSQ